MGGQSPDVTKKGLSRRPCDCPHGLSRSLGASLIGTLPTHLNNIRMRSWGDQRHKDVEPRRLTTSIVATADMNSDFVFRSDLAYDWDVSLFDAISSTLFYQDDCFESLSRQYGRLRRMSAYFNATLGTDVPSVIQMEPDMLAALNREFERRFLYHGGMHVSDTYTYYR